MRRATVLDIPRLKIVYDEAIDHAESVGHIDWPKPFPITTLQEYIDDRELFCFERSNLVVAAMRLCQKEDAKIWENDEASHLYLGKAATSSAVRSEHYFETTMFPAAVELLGQQGTSLRLDCLADNRRLRQFYETLGFLTVGDATFYSTRQAMDITVTRMELALRP